MDFVGVDTSFINWILLGKHIDTHRTTHSGRAEYMAEFTHGFLDYYYGQCYIVNASRLAGAQMQPIRDL